MTATDELRRMLDERGVEWMPTAWNPQRETFYHTANGVGFCADEYTGGVRIHTDATITPSQAVEATLGRVSPTWERWHKSLRHDEIKSIGDAVEQLMYEVIEFGGDMGPNGNTYNGIDEGDVLTSGFINDWIARFESTLGRDRYSYGQYREIADAVGDAMEYAHDRAVEHPDKADPLWNLDEYVSRILKVAFKGEAPLGRGTCRIRDEECDQCGALIHEHANMYWVSVGEGMRTVKHRPVRFCPNCGAEVVR